MFYEKKCETCVSDRRECGNCRDNPKFADYPEYSHYMAYIPTCPRGYKDCVRDPAYILYNHPDTYKRIYGDKSPFEVAERCRKAVAEDPDEEYYCYDDEDK